MIKKLYSKRTDSKKSEDPRISVLNQVDDLSLSGEQQEILNSILKREKVRYSYWRMTFFKYFSVFNACFCCCKSCFKKSPFEPPQDDKDFRLSQKMLLQEIDLLDILQQLRVLKVLVLTQTSQN